MKRCPKCNAEYLDNTLEFCLEDGSRLAFANDARGTAATSPQTAADTVAFGLNQAPIVQAAEEVETVLAKTSSIIPVAGSKSAVLENVPIVIALAHNWWQWLYLEGQHVYSIASYIFSANFLMWLLLLIAGVIVGIWSVKQSERKVVAYASLVMLAINLILFIVPRR